jgi:hypothetical protein
MLHAFVRSPFRNVYLAAMLLLSCQSSANKNNGVLIDSLMLPIWSKSSQIDEFESLLDRIVEKKPQGTEDTLFNFAIANQVLRAHKRLFVWLSLDQHD